MTGADASLRASKGVEARAAGLADGGVDKAGAGVDAACAGREIALGAVIVDKRCATDARGSKKLRAALEVDGAVTATLRQEAKRVGDEVELRLVNAGSAACALPLSFHAALPAFTVLAEDASGAVYELAPPRFRMDVEDAGTKVYFAHIEIAPGGAAFARLVPSTTVTKRLDKKCDGGSCAPPARLPAGHYVLHVGELVADVEAGAPARVGWDVP